MSQAGKRRPEPVDERGSLKEASEFPPQSDKAPPPRLPSLTFPTDRLPQLDVEIVKSLPGVGQNENDTQEKPLTNHNIDPSLPAPIRIEKTLYNLWEKSLTQTEVKWSKPENHSNFSGMLYEIQIKTDEDWQDLADNRREIYRVYFTEGVAIFGRKRITQDSHVKMIQLRIRPVGENTERGMTRKVFGPWSEEVVFSLEKPGTHTYNPHSMTPSIFKIS